MPDGSRFIRKSRHSRPRLYTSTMSSYGRLRYQGPARPFKPSNFPPTQTSNGKKETKAQKATTSKPNRSHMGPNQGDPLLTTHRSTQIIPASAHYDRPSGPNRAATAAGPGTRNDDTQDQTRRKLGREGYPRLVSWNRLGWWGSCFRDWDERGMAWYAWAHGNEHGKLL